MLRDLLLGFIKIHILHHASQQPVYGLWMMEELARHGYTVSPAGEAALAEARARLAELVAEVLEAQG